MVLEGKHLNLFLDCEENKHTQNMMQMSFCVFSGEDAYKKTRAGATIFQLYIGFAYGGPALIPQKNLSHSQSYKVFIFVNVSLL